MIISEGLSVRELERIIRRMRGWYLDNEYNSEDRDILTEELPRTMNPKESDLVQIENALSAEFNLPRGNNFRSCSDFHVHGPYGMSVFSIFWPSPLIVGSDLKRNEKRWWAIAPTISPKIKDIRVQFFGTVAITTCYVSVASPPGSKLKSGSYGGTVVFLRKGDRWKMIHQHWSRVGLRGWMRKYSRENSEGDSDLRSVMQNRST